MFKFSWGLLIGASFGFLSLKAKPCNYENAYIISNHLYLFLASWVCLIVIQMLALTIKWCSKGVINYFSPSNPNLSILDTAATTQIVKVPIMSIFTIGLFAGSFLAYAALMPTLIINNIEYRNIYYYVGEILGFFLGLWLLCFIIKKIASALKR